MSQPGFEETRTVTLPEVSLAYREQGAGEPVVFVHGGLSDLRTWDAQLPAVSRCFRAIAYSRRYARPNRDIDPAADDPMPAHVEDLTGFLRAIDAVPAHLVGNSWGAFIALLTAVRHPDAVRTLVLEEPPVIPLFLKGVPPGPGELVRLLASRPRTALALLRTLAGSVLPARRASRRGQQERAMQHFARGVLGDEAFGRLSEARKQQMRDNASTLRAQLLGEGFPPLADDDVRSVAVPVLLLTGERSPAFLLRLTDRLEELLPHVERVEIPGASHAMHEDAPAAVNRAILRFLVGARSR